MLALLTSKTAGYAVGAVLLALACWWGYGHIYDNGYQAATLKYETQIADEHAALAEADANEQRRQTIANNAAKQREAAALAAIETQEAENLELRKRLADEARQDPDADKPSLGAGSVQRIDKIH